MDDLVQFLRARLDEVADRAMNWHDLECEIHEHLDDTLLASLAASRMLHEVPGAVCDCGGPARVLAEVEAKRQILELHTESSSLFCAHCEHEPPCPTLRLLALPYADHPDCRDTWRP